MDWTFSINQYERDGDIIDCGVFIHVGDITSIKFENSEELEAFANRILKSLPEIRENEKK